MSDKLQGLGASLKEIRPKKNMARPRKNNRICKICGRPALVSYNTDGSPYQRALCRNCKNRQARYGAIFNQASGGINPLECERCGWEGYCDIHHKDNDHHNNKMGNLEVLCPNCHRTLHSPLLEATTESAQLFERL